MRPPERPQADGLTFLREGDVEVEGRMPWSSNGTYLVEVCGGDETMRAVYKPVRGERPLWDFPDGLYRREVAAYVVSEALGWGLVPETVLREGPLGPGSLQRFVDAIERIRADHPGGTVVAVSHADPIKAAAADAVGTPLDLFQRIVISPCSVTAILYGDSSPIALTVNSTGDLKALAPS